MESAHRIDRPTALRVAAVQLLLVAATATALALALPTSFFEDWGWLSGPSAWALCAMATALIVGLPVAPTLAGAALAGLPSLLAVIAGLHWLGALIAVALFALWCGAIAVRRGPVAAA